MDHQNTLSPPPPPPPPHVLIFPLPLQGPVNVMLKLAELLSLANFHVTFLNTDHIQNRLNQYSDVQTRFSRYPRLRFETISDGLSEDHPRSGDRFMELFGSMEAVTFPLFEEMLTSGQLGSNGERPVTCIIADGAFGFAIDVADKIGVPILYFETVSPCGLWSYLCVTKLIEAGELPFTGDDLDTKITSVPGTEDFLRRRDLPSFYRISDLTNPIIQLILKEAQAIPRAKGLILNTFEELEGPLLSHMRTLSPNIYSIGPLHTFLKTKLSPKMNSEAKFSNSLWEEDESCIVWLDSQPLKSVLYVSIGSLAVMTREQFMEFWHGLVNSDKRFLWVIRPGSVPGEHSGSHIPLELSNATKERGCIVGWAPQEEVLRHPAIGGFLTHSGWNSTLESIVEGVPMLCWPYFVDQQVNSRYVEEVWKFGLDMKDTCDRMIVEKMVRELMDERKEEFLWRMNQMSKLGIESVNEGGSSYLNLERLIEDIGLMSHQV